MEINLLNRKGIHTKSDHDFSDVDKSFILKADQVSSNDFESEHKVDTGLSIKRSDRGKIFFVCLFTALIVGFSIYYQFFINQKVVIESDKLRSLIQYVINDEDLNLLEFKFQNYSIDLKFEINSDGNFSNMLKSHASNLMSSDKYRAEIVKYGDIQVISIKYPPFLEVVNSDFSKDFDLDQYGAIDQINIDKKSLNNFLNNDFNRNVPKVPNFKINRSDDTLYNIVFSE